METQNSKVKDQKYKAKVKNDLSVRLYKYSLAIIKLLEKLPHQRVYWVIADQLLRSATSMGANVVEAKSASSRRDFIKFYEIALKSANETKYWLALLRDGTSVDKTAVFPLIVEVNELANILAVCLLRLKGK